MGKSRKEKWIPIVKSISSKCWDSAVFSKMNSKGTIMTLDSPKPSRTLLQTKNPPASLDFNINCLYNRLFLYTYLIYSCFCLTLALYKAVLCLLFVFLQTSK